MTVKTAAKSFGSGLATVATALHNSGLNVRISEIDAEVAELQTQIDTLKSERRNLTDRRI